jgi:hypothetical protein
MRALWLIAALCGGLAACGGNHHPPPPVRTAPPFDIRGAMARQVAIVDDQVRFADNGRYNRFTWMTDGSFCYLTQSKTEILNACFQPAQVDSASVAVRGAGSLGAPFDRIAFSCSRAGCVKRSSQLTSMFGPRGYQHMNALSMPTRRGGGHAAAAALHRLLTLAAQAGPEDR